MVAWNPDVPNPNDSTPKWGRDSQPITQWQGDQTMEKLFGGIGNALDIGVKGIDFAIKNDIDKKAYAGVDSERDAYTAALEGGYAAVGPKAKDGESAERLAKGYGNTESPPQDIDKRLGYLQSIQEGAAAGKVNDTYYKGRLVALVKDIRADYPGYREYIDKKVASITGFDPANQKINDLLTDINNLAGKKEGAEANRILHRLEQAAVDGDELAAQMWNKRKSGQLDDETALSFLAKRNKGKYEAEVLKREVDQVQNNDALGKNTFSKSFDKESSSLVSTRMSAMDYGLFQGNPELMDKVRRHNEGTQRMKSEDLNQVASLLNQRMKDTEDQLYEKAKAKNPNGLSAIDVLGAEEINKRIAAQLAPMRAQVEHVRKGDLSAATFQTRKVQSMQEDDLANLYADPKMAPLVRTTNALTKGLGSDNVAVKFLENSNFVKNKQTIDTYLNNATTRMAQQGEQDNPAGLITLKGEVQKYKQNATKIPVATTTQGLLQRVEQMMLAPEDAKLPDNLKVGILKSIAAPEGRGLMNEFNKDSRQSAYDKLTSPAFAREAYRVTRDHPEGESIWRQYEDFAKQEWGVGIFSNYIKDLSAVNLPAGYKLGWDDKKKEFTLNDLNGRNILYDQSMPNTPGGDKYRGYETGDRTLDRFAPSLRQINKGVFNIRNIAEATGKTGNDVDAYVMGFLTQAGWTPSAQNADYLPAHMVKAIYNTGLAESLLKRKMQNEQSTGYAE